LLPLDSAHVDRAAAIALIDGPHSRIGSSTPALAKKWYDWRQL